LQLGDYARNIARNIAQIAGQAGQNLSASPDIEALADQRRSA
jgi:hypothetical protein